MSIETFFSPTSVAVVGASRRKGKVGHEILSSIIGGGFEGDIFPVNPSADEIAGLACYKDLESIGQSPELVVIATPAPTVPEVVRQCVDVGVKSVVVVTSGFREIGDAGKRLEDEVSQLVRRSSLRLIGPNCLGVMSPAHKLNASFGGPLPPVGNIGYFSQSGSLLAAIVDMARGEGVGFSKLVSIGNKADVTELDILKAFGRDDEVQIIAGYLETITDGDAFISEAERISHDKPILLMKAGETSAGAIAAHSHTGRMINSQRAYEVVFERAGVIRCESITAQFDYARGLARGVLPPGVGVAVVANAGGAGIMAADAAERHGLELATLTENTRNKLAEKLPAAANVSNPIDVLGDALAGRFEHALTTVLDDPNVDIALVLLTPHAMTECVDTANAVVRVAGANPAKPILACFLGDSRVEKAVAVLREGNIPCFKSPEFAVSTIKMMTDYYRWRNRPKRVVKLFSVNRHKVQSIIDRNLRAGNSELGETETKEIIEAYGFVTPKGLLATSATQAAEAAGQLGFPVVIKSWSPDIVHKVEVGGVRSGLSSPQEVMDAFDLMMYRIPKQLPDANILGVLVQETCGGGQEVILGMNRDPHYGPLMMFGMGGIMVEVLKDVAFYLAPLTNQEAKQMLMSTKTYHLLIGGPGRPGVDIDAIAEGLQRLSQLVTEFPQIQEMDINPYIVGQEGTTPVAVDASINLRQA